VSGYFFLFYSGGSPRVAESSGATDFTGNTGPQGAKGTMEGGRAGPTSQAGSLGASGQIRSDAGHSVAPGPSRSVGRRRQSEPTGGQQTAESTGNRGMQYTIFSPHKKCVVIKKVLFYLV